MEKFETLVQTMGDHLWTYLLIALLIGCGLLFTFLTRGIQFRKIGEMLRLLAHSEDAGVPIEAAVEVEHQSKPGNQAKATVKKKHISPFQAFAVAMAGRVGTGNIAGVATAIFIGGPGAVFWMWLLALVGSATSFVECTLAQLFKRKSKDSFVGGPAYYMLFGLGKKWMGVIFAVLMIFTFGLANSSVQSNTICAAWEQAFGFNGAWMGAVLTVFVALIVFGGIQRIAKVSSAVVPFMAIIYLLIALYVIIANISSLPGVFKIIFQNAFGLGPAIGGGFGAAIMQGVRRGLFSNEAGEGSTPNVASTATTSHPVKQGLIQALGVFTDTLVVCSCTAFLILMSGVYMGASNGVNLTQDALTSQIGAVGNPIIAITILLFAFTTILGNYYYGEANLLFITKKSWSLLIYRLAVVAVVMMGALMSLGLAWALVDLLMGLLTLCNLIAVLLLYKYVSRLLKDYESQKKRGIKEPEFHRSTLPEIADKLDAWE